MTQVLVMGVSGSGKTTVGTALAEAIGADFIEGDAFHPPDNVARMSAGVPLDDAARQPWLNALANDLRRAAEGGRSVVLACSSLKAAYRETLRSGCPTLRTVWLDVPRHVLEQRLRDRSGHFMPASLLESQIADLESPVGEIAVDGTLPVSCLVRGLRVRL